MLPNSRLLLLPLLTVLCGCQLFGPAQRPPNDALSPDATPLIDLRAPEPLTGLSIQDAYGDAIGKPTLAQPAKKSKGAAPHLSVKLPHPGDALALDFNAATPNQSERDWRPYAALQFRVSAFPDAARLEVGLETESSGMVTWQPVNLPRGGGRARVELPDLAAVLDLTHIRRVLWRPVGASPDFSFDLDDIVLLDQMRWLVQPSEQPGDLFVQQRGKRLIVGATGRFMFELRRGQIVRWTQGESRNLTVESGLGPWPIPLPDGWQSNPDAIAVFDNPVLFIAWGDRVLTRQECIEASRFRAVIRAEWRYRGEHESAAPSPDDPGHTWQYTIYPNGEIYVSIRSQAPAAGWPAPRVGYAVALDDRAGFQRLPYAPQAGRRQPSFVALPIPETDLSGLLWVPGDATIAAQQAESITSGVQSRAVIVGGIAPSPSVESAHLLHVWPELKGIPEARVRAGDYQEPPIIKLTRGSLRTDIAGDGNHDGFNEAEGCYEVVLDAGTLNCRFEPGAWPRAGVLVRVHGTVGKNCWAYQDGRPLNGQGRDAGGELLLRLGRFENTATALEVTIKR